MLGPQHERIINMTISDGNQINSSKYQVKVTMFNQLMLLQLIYDTTSSNLNNCSINNTFSNPDK